MVLYSLGRQNKRKQVAEIKISSVVQTHLDRPPTIYPFWDGTGVTGFQRKKQYARAERIYFPPWALCLSITTEYLEENDLLAEISRFGYFDSGK